MEREADLRAMLEERQEEQTKTCNKERKEKC